MAFLSRGIRNATIVIGFLLLALAAGAITCGAVELSKVDGNAATTIGFWGAYFILSGVLCLVAGFGNLVTAFFVALGLHIFGILIALAGFSYASVVWAVLDASCFLTSSDRCSCILNSKIYNFGASCSDLKTVRDVNAALTIIYVILLIVSFVGAILGCVGARCGNQMEPHTVRIGRPYVLPGYPETMTMTRHREKHFHPHSREERYVQDGRYVQERIYNHRGPFVELGEPYREEKRHKKEERPYMHEEKRYIEKRPYRDERRYMEERPYMEGRRYIEHKPRVDERSYFEGGRYNNAYDRQPSYLAAHTTRDEERMFAGHTNAQDTTGHY